ncbi:hypothetical protein KEM52_001140 [Ascosphaera acerosa]|nr:hypothetical protein KEM52_001140 [Ascosphaera acerosa]
MGGDEREGGHGRATIADDALTAAKVGSVAGALGLLYGATTGVLRGRHPVIRSIAMGIQWSVFGASFWTLRSLALSYGLAGDQPASPLQRAAITAAASGLAGGVTTYTLVSRRFLPAFLALGAGGFIGQRVYDAVDAMQLRQAEEAAADPAVRAQRKKPLEQRLLESKWTLLKPLSDEDYVEMLEDRKTQVEVEIALVEEKMAELRKAVSAEREATRGAASERP